MEIKDLLIQAMREAGYYYDVLESYNGYHRFLGDIGNPMVFESFKKAEDWLRGVVIDDPDISRKVDALIEQIDEVRGMVLKDDKEKYSLTNVKIQLVVSEEDTLYSEVPMNSPDNAVMVMRNLLSRLDREYVAVVNLDTALKPINYNIVSIGNIDSSMVPMVNVIKSGILSNAASIMLFHSHPSGNINPSKQDYEVTKRAIQMGKLMEIPLIDHIIVGGNKQDYYSFRHSEPHMFDVAYEADKVEELLQSKVAEDKENTKDNTRRVTHVRH